MTGAPQCDMTGTLPSDDTDATAPDTPPAAVSARLVVLNKRADFVRASNALRHSTKGLNLQARAREPGRVPSDALASGIRVWFTCSKKVGNAVARNRAKRRLREVARLVLARHGRPGFDYVLIGKNAATAARPFADLQEDLRVALDRIHAAPADRSVR